MAGVHATGHVVRGGNREVTVSVDLVCRYPDGQVKYEVLAVGKVTIPAGDPVPVFEVNGRPHTEGQDPLPVTFNGGPVFSIHSHTVCRDPQGNIKWEADTEPIALCASEPTPPALVGVNTVVLATPHPEDSRRGH